MSSELERLEHVFRALGDDIRLQILAMLARGEVCVFQIHDALGIPQPTASRHLAYLRRYGLVTSRRDGLWIYYRLATPTDPQIGAILAATLDSLAHIPMTSPRYRSRSGHVQPGLSHSSPDFLD